VFQRKIMRYLPFLLVGFLATTCTCAQTKTRPPITIKQINPPDTSPQYFPVGLFDTNAQLSDWIARWYASELRRLEESSLTEAKTDRDPFVYRFLLIPSFTPSFLVRLTINPDGTGTLTAKTTADETGKASVTLNQQTENVSAENVSKFLTLLSEVDFWSLPTEAPRRGLDGQVWLLEGRKGRKYHVVDRWCPERQESCARACQYLLDLSTLKVGRYR
jgi:hypothetical protein